MAESNIHDVTIDHKLVPMPYKPWADYKARIKIEAAKLGTIARTLMMKPGYGPKMSELPTHFVLKEGKYHSKEFEWPRASQDPYISCVSKTQKDCTIFSGRGYYCRVHRLTSLPKKQREYFMVTMNSKTHKAEKYDQNHELVV